MGIGMDNHCVNRVMNGAAMGGALGASIGSLYGTYDAFRLRVPGVYKIRHIGQTTVASAGVDNETDGISSPCQCCQGGVYQSEFVQHAQKKGMLELPGLLWGGHGLSLLLEAQAGDQQHSMVFDAGPSGELWARNVSQMEALGTVVQPEAFVLSHWHVDHSGGLMNVLQHQKDVQGPDLLVDLHPDRPHRRGFTVPTGKAIPFTMEATLKDIKGAGGKIELSKESHTLLDDFFYVSGEIPRQVSYEFGLPGHVTQQADGSWKEDLLIMDERYLAVKVKGLGPIVFSACSHAGIVNVMKDLQSKAGRLHAVMGGFHLAGASVEGRIADTVKDIVAMDPQLVLAGHCTGWRAKAALVNALPDRYQPCVVGAVFNFAAKE